MPLTIYLTDLQIKTIKDGLSEGKRVILPVKNLGAFEFMNIIEGGKSIFRVIAVQTESTINITPEDFEAVAREFGNILYPHYSGFEAEKLSVTWNVGNESLNEDEFDRVTKGLERQ